MKSSSSWDRMDSMAGVRSAGVMEVNLGRDEDWRRGFSVTVDILRVCLDMMGGEAVTKARTGRWRRVARARETIFIAEGLYLDYCRRGRRIVL